MPQIRDLLTELTTGFAGDIPRVKRSKKLFRRGDRRDATPRVFGATYTPTDQLKRLFKKLELNGNENYEGSIKDVADFVDWLMYTVEARDKRGVRMEGQLDALDEIGMALDGPPVSAFPQIDPAKFYFQLAVRVMKPQWIHQWETDLCAAAAWISQMARTETFQYCSNSILLFQNGRCVINGIEITAHRFIRRGLSLGGMAACDYVVLTSARNSAAVLKNNFEAVHNLTTRRVAMTLRHARYCDVQLCAIGDRGIVEIGEPHLKEMAAKLDAGHNVLMVDDLNICGALWCNQPIDPTVAKGRHLSYVVKMRLDEKYVREITVFTWGKACKGRDILIAEFLPHLMGYISYRDRR